MGRAPDPSTRGTIAPSAPIVGRGQLCRTRINQGESHIKAQMGRVIAPRAEEFAWANSPREKSAPIN